MSIPKNQKKTIIYIYTSAFCVSVLFICLMVWRSQLIKQKNAQQQANVNFTIETNRKEGLATIKIPQDKEALTGLTQNGNKVSTNELQGKVWVICQFYSKCPYCQSINFNALKKIYTQFKDQPNFHLVSVNINKEVKDPLANYAKQWGADEKNWWFLLTDVPQFNTWIDNKLFAPFIETPEDTKEPIKHDMNIIVIGPQMHVVERLDIYSAITREGLSAEQREEAQNASINQLIIAIESELSLLNQ